MFRARFISIVLLLVAGCGIPTRFVGAPVVSPQNPGQAPAHCQEICRAWGMELTGMVSMGERYSDGCICSAPSKQVSPAAAATAAQIAAAGVVIQEQQDEESSESSRRSSESQRR